MELRHKIVIYTCLTGDYDKLREPSVKDDRFDYIYFSTHKVTACDSIWQYRKLKKEGLDKIRLSRLYKLRPHLVLNDYDYCVYMDANLQIINKSIYDQIIENIEEDALWVGIKHPARNCIYEEGYAVVVSRKANYFKVKSFLKKMMKSGFPHNFGMTENNFILRSLRSPQVLKICDEWWNLFIESNTQRDQLCLPVVFWRNNFNPKYFSENKNTWTYPGLERYTHSDNNPQTKLSTMIENFKEKKGYYTNRCLFVLFGPITKKRTSHA